MRELTTSLMKAYYRPIEAAIRKSDLHHFESSILEQPGNHLRPSREDLPRRPNLHLNSERIDCALYNGDLSFGKLGIPRTRNCGGAGNPCAINANSIWPMGRRCFTLRRYPRRGWIAPIESRGRSAGAARHRNSLYGGPCRETKEPG